MVGEGPARHDGHARRMDRTQEGAVAAMFTASKAIIDQHLESLRAEAAARRAFRVESSGRISRLVAAMSSLRGPGTATAETASSGC